MGLGKSASHLKPPRQSCHLPQEPQRCTDPIGQGPFTTKILPGAWNKIEYKQNIKNGSKYYEVWTAIMLQRKPIWGWKTKIIYRLGPEGAERRPLTWVLLDWPLALWGKLQGEDFRVELRGLGLLNRWFPGAHLDCCIGLFYQACKKLNQKKMVESWGHRCFHWPLAMSSRPDFRLYSLPSWSLPLSAGLVSSELCQAHTLNGCMGYRT